MQSFITRLRMNGTPDSGSSLVEVLVAMLVFAILAVGIAFSLLTVLAMTKEGRLRQAATNLAAEEIDRVRSAKDVFSLGDATRPVPTANGTFVLTRTTQWVSEAGAGTGCGTGSDSFRYKRISIQISWDGMRDGALPVRTDTLLSPRSGISDPARGTLVVSVQTASGAGAAGVSVSADPTPGVSGNTAVAVPAAATDVRGCIYLRNVEPGSYDVSITQTGYIDNRQVANTTKATNIAVTAGTSASAGFVFDQAGWFSVLYASNAGSDRPRFPSNLDTSFLSTGGVHVSAATGTDSPLQLFPVPGGYAVMAGKYVAPNESSTGCISVDPEAWPESTTKMAGVRTLSTPKAEDRLQMGLLPIAGVSGQFIKAVSFTGEAGEVSDEPGCSVPMTYTFDALTFPVKIALPYGSWTLYSGTSRDEQTEPVLAASISSASMEGAAPAAVSSATNIATLDPRRMK